MAHCNALEGCVVYNMLYVVVITPIAIAMFGFMDLKWNMPPKMLSVYLLGRLIFALAPTMEIQIFLAAPLIAIGYFWAHLCYTKHFFVASVEIRDDLLQLIPWITGVVISVITLCRFKQW